MAQRGSSDGTAHIKDHEGQAPMLTDLTHWTCPRCHVQVYPASAQAGHRCVGFDAYVMHGVYPMDKV